MIANLQEQCCSEIALGILANMQAMENDKELIQALVDFTGLSASEIARRAGMAVTTLTRPLNQEVEHKISLPTLTKLRAAFPDFPGFRDAGSAIPILSASRDVGAVALRVLDLDLSMGDGSNIDDYAEVGTVDFDAGLLRKLTRTRPDRLFMARGSGDSMFPTLVNGDMVMIDPSQDTLKLQDRLWAISLFGAGGIKRLQPVAPGRVEVISDNPARDNRVVDAIDLRILGRVIWVGREV